jgi:hypothetical protein
MPRPLWIAFAYEEPIADEGWPERIRRCFSEDRVLYSRHARREMRMDEFGPIPDRQLYEAATGMYDC